MNKLLFKKGNSTNLPINKDEGTFYLLKDKKEIHIDDIILKNSEDIESKLSQTYQSVEYSEEVVDLFTPATSGQTLDEAIHTVESNVSILVNETLKNEKAIATAITSIKTNVGLDESLQYVPNAESTYISAATSLTEADIMLDNTIKELDDKVDEISSSIIEINETLDNSIKDINDKLNQSENELYAAIAETNVTIKDINENVFTSELALYAAIAEVNMDLNTAINDTKKIISDKEEVIAAAISTISESIGLDENLKYVPNTESNYISAATSLAEADTMLDNAIKELRESKLSDDYESVLYDERVSDLFTPAVNGQTLDEAIHTVESNVATLVFETLENEKAVTSSFYDIQESIGLDENLQYVPNTESAYISAATSLAEANTMLDNAIKELDYNINDIRDIITNDTSLQDLKNEINNNINDLRNDFNDIIENSKPILSENYQSVEYSEEVVDLFTPATSGQTLDEAIYTVESNVSTLVNETLKNEKAIATAITSIKTNVGLDENLQYAPNADSTYISAATSFTEADIMLDNAIKEVDGKITNVEVSLGEKVDKIQGKGLSSEDFTTILKEKLISLNNYDDTNINNLINELRNNFNELVSGDTSVAINNFNEIINFLQNIEDSASLNEILNNIRQLINDAVNSIPQGTSNLVNDAFFITKEDVKLSENYQKVLYNEEITNLFTPAISGQTLDEAIYTVESNVSTLVNETLKNEKAITAAITSIKTNVGLDENLQYAPSVESAYISAATSLAEANTMLDNAIKEVDDNVINVKENINEISSSIKDINNKLNQSENELYAAIAETNVTLDNTIKDINEKNFTLETSLYAAIAEVNMDLNTAIDDTKKIISDKEEVIAAAISTISESIGLDENLKYAPSVESAYISAATSLIEADIMLDNAIKELRESKLSDDYESVLYDERVSDLFTPAVNGQTLDEVIHTVETNVATLVFETLENEKVVTSSFYDIQESIGLDENLQYVPNAKSNYISAATSLAEANTMLDNAIKELDDKVKEVENIKDNFYISGQTLFIL